MFPGAAYNSCYRRPPLWSPAESTPDHKGKKHLHKNKSHKGSKTNLNNPSTRRLSSKMVNTPHGSTDKVNDPTIPKNAAKNKNATPKGASAAGVPTRGRSNTRRLDPLPPSLLTDFFLGRPSPARRAAQKARRQSMDAIKAELRQEMRAEAVRKVQPPGGVRDRVKAWQKNNAAAMAEGDPMAAPSIPGDVAFESENESVLEDRLQTRSRSKRSTTPKAKNGTGTERVPDLNEGSRSMPVKINAPPKKRVVSDDHWMKIHLKKKASNRRKSPNTAARIPKNFTQQTMNPAASSKVREWVKQVETPEIIDTRPPMTPSSSSPYKNYRYTKSLSSMRDRDLSEDGEDDSNYESASDGNYEDEDDMPRRKRTQSAYGESSIFVEPLRMGRPRAATSAVSAPYDDGIRVRGSEIADDGIRITSSETVDDGIRITATETADDGIRVTASEPQDGSIRITPPKPADDGIRVTAFEPVDDGIRITPSEPLDDGIRITPSEPSDDGTKVTSELANNGIQVSPSEPPEPPTHVDSPKPPPAFDDGIRVQGSNVSDGIRITPSEPLDDGIRIGPIEATTSALSEALDSAINEVQAEEEDSSYVSSVRPSKVKKTGVFPPRKRKSEIDIKPKPMVRSHTTNNITDDPKGQTRIFSGKSPKQNHKPRRRTKSMAPPVARSMHTCSVSTGSSYSPSSEGFTEIPVGNSAFSVLELPVGAEANNTRQNKSAAKTKRAPSFRDVPSVLKKVLGESKKILQDPAPKPAPVMNQPAPARIENWLNSTVEPESNHGNTPIKKIIEKEWAHESINRRSSAEIPSLQGSKTEPKSNQASSPLVDRTKSKNEKEKEIPAKKVEKERPVPLSPIEAPKALKISKASPPPSSTPSPQACNRTPTQHKKVKKTASTSSLQRKGANRSNTVSSKSSSVKRPFKETLKDAFRGESAGGGRMPSAYQSHEERSFSVNIDLVDPYLNEQYEQHTRHHRTPTSESDLSCLTGYSVPYSDANITDSDLTPAPLAPLRTRKNPPTQGHPLSTIIAEDQAIGPNSGQTSDQNTDVSGATPAKTSTTQATSIEADWPKTAWGDGIQRQPGYVVNRQPSYLSTGIHSVTRNPSYLSIEESKYDQELSFMTGDDAQANVEQSFVSGAPETLNRNPSFTPGPGTINRNPSFVAGKPETINRNLSYLSTGQDKISHNLSFVSSRKTLDRRNTRTSRASSKCQNSIKHSDSRYSRRSNSERCLKRKLTKHSDLVSVLSTTEEQPDSDSREESQISTRSGLSRRSRASTIRGNRASGLGQGTIAGLLRDFAAEEAAYGKELKALVDGVVPVLLKEVVNWDGKSPLFGDPTAKGDAFSKSIVDMGVCLEKLRNSHKKAPLTDIYQLFAWLERIQPVYDAYLDAWKLGFQDLVVNLAPIMDSLDDNDSLIDAMPRNNEGDWVDANGERLDVAHFLKRPLQRIKRMVKFLKGVTKVLPSATTSALLESFEHLQEKARRRYNEEVARLTDKEAAETNTSQCLDLKTMEPLAVVSIDQTRQVNAKDIFSLTLWHTNGQRMECEVELVHRDKPQSRGDVGDLLIRKTGEKKQSWLLFQPVTMDFVSGRRDGNGIIVMIRGVPRVGEMEEWRELLHFATDDELQIQDWLEIFSPDPMPQAKSRLIPAGPSPFMPDLLSPELSTIMEVPSGSEVSHTPPVSAPVSKAKSKSKRGRGSPLSAEVHHEDIPNVCDITLKPSAPRQQSPSPKPQKPPSSPDSDRTIKEAIDEDKPPAPPVHRTLSKSKPEPPVLMPEPLHRMGRRGSSPLKHEYLPSEVSSQITEEDDDAIEVEVCSDPEDSYRSRSGSYTSSYDYTGSQSESEGSSSDELDSIDMPETELGISIRNDERRQRELRAATASVMTYDSLTPSKSASQVCGRDESDEETEIIEVMNQEPPMPDYQGPRWVATISQWTDKKATWKDLHTENCWVVILPGVLEVHKMGTPNIRIADPLLALELTPKILLRQSTFIDLEVRATTLDTGKIFVRNGANFRFRMMSTAECYQLYKAVHDSRLQNERYNKMAAEARYQAFGQGNHFANNESSQGGNTPAESVAESKRTSRSWFGRKNSYRASARAPTNDSGSNAPSNQSAASSFLRRLTGGNLSFNLAKSTLDRHGGGSLYSADSNGLRPPSLYSMQRLGSIDGSPLGTDAIRIRLHLLVTPAKWEDWGNCILTISKPPEGARQDLRRNHGLEKRVTVSTIPKKNSDEQPKPIIDAVLGSGCFSQMGNRGVICGIWEEVKDEKGVRGRIPQNGNAAGNITKWCFQCKNGQEAQWVLRNLHQEVLF